MSSGINKFFLVIGIATLLLSCREDDGPLIQEERERAEIEEVNVLGNYTKETIENLISSFPVSLPVQLNYSVKALSVSYYTIDGNENIELASGAISCNSSIRDLFMEEEYLKTPFSGPSSEIGLVASIMVFPNSRSVPIASRAAPSTPARTRVKANPGRPSA